MENSVIAGMAYKNLWRQEDAGVSTDVPVAANPYLQENQEPDQPSGASVIFYDASSHTSMPYMVVNSERFGELRQQCHLHQYKKEAWLKSYHGITGAEFTNPIHALGLPCNILPKKWSELPDATNLYIIDPDSINDRYRFDGAEKLVLKLAANSTKEVYEPGIDDEFTQMFESAVLNYGNEFLKYFAENTHIFRINSLLSFIEILGRLEHQGTKTYRIWLLNEFMSNKSAIVRDVASMALADLAGSKATGYLIKAIESETNLSLKSDMEMLLDDITMES